MSALLETLAFNALQKKSIPSRHCANREFLDHVTSKWHIPEEGTFSTIGTCSGINNCVYLKTSEDGSSPDRLVFYGNRESLPYDKAMFRDLGSPLCLYRLGCTFPSAVHIEQTNKSARWSGFTHKATGWYFGITDMKGYPDLRTVQEESDLRSLFMEDGQWQLFKDLSVVCRLVGKTISRLYLEELPKELVDHLSDPDTGDVIVLKKMQDFVDTNNIFTSDIAELLGYLDSDQWAHGYGDLVAG